MQLNILNHEVVLGIHISSSFYFHYSIIFFVWKRIITWNLYILYCDFISWILKGQVALIFKQECPPLSFLTIEGRAAANPPLPSRLTSICRDVATVGGSGRQQPPLDPFFFFFFANGQKSLANGQTWLATTLITTIEVIECIKMSFCCRKHPRWSKLRPPLKNF